MGCLKKAKGPEPFIFHQIRFVVLIFFYFTKSDCNVLFFFPVVSTDHFFLICQWFIDAGFNSVWFYRAFNYRYCHEAALHKSRSIVSKAEVIMKKKQQPHPQKQKNSLRRHATGSYKKNQKELKREPIHTLYS